MTLQRLFDVPDVLSVQVVPSDEVKIVPESPEITKRPFPYEIPLSLFDDPDSLEVHEIPSDEVRIDPESPLINKSPFVYLTLLKLSDDPEVLEVHVVPSEEVRIVPLSPTLTNNPVEVVVELSVLVVLDELLDEVQDMEMKLKRNTEKIMSRYFTWFPIIGLGEPNI